MTPTYARGAGGRKRSRLAPKDTPVEKRGRRGLSLMQQGAGTATHTGFTAPWCNCWINATICKLHFGDCLTAAGDWKPLTTAEECGWLHGRLQLLTVKQSAPITPPSQRLSCRNFSCGAAEYARILRTGARGAPLARVTQLRYVNIQHTRWMMCMVQCRDTPIRHTPPCCSGHVRSTAESDDALKTRPSASLFVRVAN